MAVFYLKLTSLNDFTLQGGPVSPTVEFKQILDSFYVTDSPLSVTNIGEMAMFYLKLTSLNDFPLQEGLVSQIGEFKQRLDSFYVTDSPLSVTNIAQMTIKLIRLNDFPIEELPTGKSLVCYR